MSIKGTFTASVLSGALLLTLATAALAAPTTVGRDPAKVADAGQAQAAVAEGEDDAASSNCSKSRKRLFIEGEGWIVRKVTICR